MKHLASATPDSASGGTENRVMDDALDTVKMCSCADCGHDLVAMKYAAALTILAAVTHSQLAPRLLAGRIKGRPYCHHCLHE